MINIGEILIANITGIIVLIMSQVSRVTNKNRKHLDDHMYNNMVYIALIAMTAETASFALDGVPGIAVHLLQYLLNAYLFLAACAVGALWVLYVDTRIYRSTKRLKAWILPIAVPYAIIVTLILCDLFGAGFIFSVTEQNVYHRGSLIIIQYITLLYYYSLSLLVALTAEKQNNHARFFPVHIFVSVYYRNTDSDIQLRSSSRVALRQHRIPIHSVLSVQSKFIHR